MLEAQGRRRAGLLLPPPPAGNPVAKAAWLLAGSLPFVFLLGIVTARLVGGAGPPQLEVAGAGRLQRAIAAPGFPGGAQDAHERLEATGLLARGRVRRPLLGPPEVVAREKQAVALLPTAPPLALGGDGTVLGPASPADFARAGDTDLPVVRCGEPPGGPEFPECARLAARLAAILLTRPDLDRFVSELDARAGPLRVVVTHRRRPVRILVVAERFEEGLEAAFRHLPALLERWPDLSRVDARVGDRLLVRRTPPFPQTEEEGGENP